MEEIKTAGGIRCMIDIPYESDKGLGATFFLHGIGEVGTDISKVLRHGPLKQLSEGINLGEPRVYIHPLNISSGWSILEIDEVVNYLIAHPCVDPNKIVGMGISLGGLGLWNYACSPAHVKKLAAIVPICGGGNDPSKAHVIVEERIPGWAAHAKNDPVVAYSVTKRMVKAVNELAGYEQIRFSEYGMYGHGAWNYFLRPEYGVYDWITFQNLNLRKKVSGNLKVEIHFSEEKGIYLTY